MFLFVCLSVYFVFLIVKNFLMWECGYTKKGKIRTSLSNSDLDLAEHQLLFFLLLSPSVVDTKENHTKNV